MKKHHAGDNTTLWWATASMPEFPSLTEQHHADVCVVGAGIAGLTTAYLLALEGKSVMVLDDGEIGGGMTGQTSAHLASALDDKFEEIERLHGEEGARIAAQSHAAAIDRIESIVIEEGIDCDFERVDGYLFMPPGASAEILDKELAAARRAGLQVERLDRAPIVKYDTGPCLRFAQQAQFHPIKYMAGLARAAERRGVRIFTNTHATDIEGGEKATVRTENGSKVVAGAAVVATNTPVNNLVVMHTKQAPYMTFVLAAKIPKGAATKALYYDFREKNEQDEEKTSSDSYHYVRLYEQLSEGETSDEFHGKPKMHDLLLVGGQDHKTGQANDAETRYARLEAWARERWDIEEVVYRWSGQVMEPVDAMAFIGRNPLDKDNVYIATGDSGNGLTHGTVAGILLTDLIMGRKSPWEDLYNPNRINVKAAGDFTKETLNMAAQYGDLFTGGDVEETAEIARTEGAVVRRSLSKVAVYCDEHGNLHERSAICPHLGCVVRWNSNEKTWDCPCHGSKFDKFGKVIVGPANSGLEPV